MGVDLTQRRIGIMGGTFDPIHYGHLVTAEVARARFHLDEVIFVPAGSPPHKQNNDITMAWHRYHLTLLATGTNPYFTVSDLELRRQGPSYTIDTIGDVREQGLAKGEDREIFFITGADAILEIMTWHRVADLLAQCSFIAATRPGYQLDHLALSPVMAKSIHFMEVPALAISSTDIRRRLASGEPIKYLLPEEVENYIYKYRLYNIPC